MARSVADFRTLHPEQQATKFRWLFMAAVAREYPAQMARLSGILPPYQAARAEGRLPYGQAGLSNYYLSESGLGEWNYTENMARLLLAVGAWSARLNLKQPDSNRALGWVEEYAFELLSELANQEKPCLVRFCERRAFDRHLGGGSFLEASGQPIAMRPLPDIETEADFLERCKENYRQTKEWMCSQGWQAEVHKSTDRHFTWAAWQRIGGLSLRAIESKLLLRGEKVALSSLQEGISSVERIVFREGAG